MSEISLRPMKYSELSWMQDMRNSPENLEHTRNPRMISNDEQEKWWKAFQKDGTQELFTIERRSHLHDGVEIIGVGGITNIEWINHAGEMSLLMEFPKNTEWALDALKLVTEYGHNTLNLFRLWVECYTDDRTELFQKAGFRVEGRKMNAVYRGGKYHHGVLLSRFQGDDTEVDVSKTVFFEELAPEKIAYEDIV